MMQDADQYLIVVSPLSEEDGGGYVARVPDLPGCFGDGETRAAAIDDAARAIAEWVDEYLKIGRNVPKPGSAEEEFRSSRAAEIKFITELRDRLRAKEQDFDDLDHRLNNIESDVQHLLDILENVEAWERFEIITKATRPKQQELFC